jgi:hypothetical protein
MNTTTTTTTKSQQAKNAATQENPIPQNGYSTYKYTIITENKQNH